MEKQSSEAEQMRLKQGLFGQCPENRAATGSLTTCGNRDGRTIRRLSRWVAAGGRTTETRRPEMEVALLSKGGQGAEETWGHKEAGTLNLMGLDYWESGGRQPGWRLGQSAGQQ